MTPGTTCAPPLQDSIDHHNPFNLRDETKGLLGMWFCERWAKWFQNILL